LSADAELATPVEIAWRAQEAFDEGGIDGWAEQTWHPDVELDMRPTGIPGLGVYEGKEAVRLFVHEWAEAFDGWHLKLLEVTPVDERTAISEWLQTGTGHESGAPVEMRFAQTVEVKDGLTIRLRTYLDVADARRAVGLEG
jgi:ketosteroid isomerase-like protein